MSDSVIDYDALAVESRYHAELLHAESDLAAMFLGESRVVRAIPPEYARIAAIRILRHQLCNVSPFYPEGAAGFELENGNAIIIYPTDIISWGFRPMGFIALSLLGRRKLTDAEIRKHVDDEKANRDRLRASAPGGEPT